MKKKKQVAVTVPNKQVQKIKIWDIPKKDLKREIKLLDELVNHYSYLSDSHNYGSSICFIFREIEAILKTERKTLISRTQHI